MSRRHSVTVECPVERTFRVASISGMFDLAIEKKTGRSFEFEIPDASEEWSIGLIVGPSGTGKTTIARHVFGSKIIDGYSWPKEKSILDGFPKDATIDAIVGTLNAVGLSSPPDWIKPFRVLSNGQQFRTTLARAMFETGDVVAMDEFTSVVDRTVAQVGSAALAKCIRAGRGCKKFVAITCHYDVLDWLQPDWMLDTRTGECARRSLRRRPSLELEVRRVDRSAWRMFAPHHYLSRNLHQSARCYGGFIAGQLVAFCAILPMLGRRRFRRVSRIVVLPDWQGIGVGRAVLRVVCSLYQAAGERVGLTTSHVGMIRALDRDPEWKTIRFAGNGNTAKLWKESCGAKYESSLGRSVVAFEFLGSS